MKLSVVIPVFNLGDHIDELVLRLQQLNLSQCEVIFVDDGSSDDTVVKLTKQLGANPSFKLLQLAQNRGAGVARNLGFRHAVGEYTLFFDGDDELHPDAIANVLTYMDKTQADCCLTRYNFQRGSDASTLSMNVNDVRIWNKLYRSDDQISTLTECLDLVEFTNYPWNKIIRTKSYKEFQQVQLFGDTLVNNDILGHWNILLHAKSVILMDAPIVTHYVADNPRNLTNRFGRERLELFEALSDSFDVVKSKEHLAPNLSAKYWSFAIRTINWADNRIDEEIRSEFRVRKKLFLKKLRVEDLNVLVRSSRYNYTWMLKNI